jgi:hypothetical protein
MATQPPIPGSAFATCVSKLVRLHELRTTGRDNCPEADALRDDMDPLWYAMTEEEQQRIRALSEDLAALAEREVQG